MTETTRKFCATPSGTVSTNGGPSIRWHESSFDGSCQPYAIYVPKSYDPSRPWPLVISLHGHSSDHILNLRRVFGRGNGYGDPDCEAKQCFPELPDVDFIVASPYGFGSMWYNGCGETDVLDVLSEVRANYNVDADRIFLTGLSMGGYGTWMLAMRRPDLFAAIAPVCPPLADWFLDFPEGLPAFSSDLVAAESPVALARNLVHVPVKIFHGAADDGVGVDNSREMAQRLREAGAHVEYVEYPGVGHNAWDNAYADASIFTWFNQFKRIDRPRSVDFSTPSLRWPGAYWVKVLQIESRPRPADIRADVSEDNTIRVVTSNVQAFALKLDAAPVDLQSEVTITWNGREVFSGVPQGSEISFGDAGNEISKHAGVEGPARDALRDRHLLVYGTHGDNPDTIRAGKEVAIQASDPGVWGDVEIPVKADSEVTEDDIRNFNLVLFGNPSTNALIARVNDYLPVRFDGDWVQSGRRLLTGHDMGMIVAYRSPLNSNRCVVVIGGDTPTTIRMASENFRYAPDYVVFDASSDFAKESTLRDWGFFNSLWGMESEG